MDALEEALQAEGIAPGGGEAERARLRQILEQLPVAMLIVGPGGGVEFYNRLAQQSFGGPLATPTSAAGYGSAYTAWDLDGRLLAAEELPLSRALRGETFAGLELRFLRGDGEKRVASTNGAPLLDPSGAIAGAMLAWVDVTERREAQDGRAFLAESSAVLAASFDYHAALSRVAWLSVPRFADFCFVDLVEPGGSRRVEVAHAEPADAPLAERLRGFSALADSQPGFPPWDALQLGRPVLIERFDPGMIDGLALDAEYAAAVRAYAPRSFLSAPLLARGQPLGVITLVMGRSGRRYRQEQLAVVEELARHAATAIDNALLYREAERARAEAEAANRAKDEFLAMLGHELRNPLAPIMTALSLMKLRGEQGSLREQQVIERQVQNLKVLVDDLLDVARITRGKIELKRRRVELATVIGKALEIASPLFEQRRHELSMDMPAAGLAVLGDEARLSQVFANLLTNAAKYTQPGGNISVNARRQAEAAVVTIRDDGMGISAELLPTVFDLFVQGQKSIERAEGGLGLGLTLVRSLLALHGGDCTAHSDGPGRGSTFTVALPALPDGFERLATPLQTARLTPGPLRRRVLVVDDNEDAAELLALALRGAGYEVGVAHDGPQALALVANFEPDLAVLDIGLPVMDGYELASRLRERSAQVRLIALTGYGQDHDRARSLNAGFEQHLVKPIELDALLKALAPPAGSDN